jgi:hypothetical protein
VKDMHIYMEPLIDELLDLYENGISAVDASAYPGSQQFNLKAALLWTIHDWPGKKSFCKFTNSQFVFFLFLKTN